MNSPEFKNIVCRICLDENVAFDWNNSLIEHSDVSYKDCYYKYTQLKQLDDDPLSSMLCENCSNGLEDVHSLIMKALDSHNFLLEVNCVKIDAEDSVVEDDNENCASADFETVLVEKPESESVMLQQFEYETFDESSIKSEDELNTFEGTDEMQYPEMLEIEEEEIFDINQYTENDVKDVSENYETRKSKRISFKRNFKNNNSNTNIYYCNKSASQSVKFNNHYESFNEASVNSDIEKVHGYINSEGLQYEDVLDGHEEYEKNLGTDHKHTEEATSTAYNETNKQKSEGGRVSNKGSLEKDVNNENSLTKSSIFNTRYKKDSQKFTLENESNSTRTKNSEATKRNRTKAKKYNQQNSQNTPRMCSYCSKILHNKYALQKHEKTHLANRERKAPCPICGVKFLEESYVKIHMQIHNQDRVKKHKCEFCDKAFYEKGSLNVHRRIHLGQMIPCTLCSKEFFRQVDLDIHMNSHSAAVINAETKKRSRYWVRCKYCNKDIMSTSFKYHTAVHLNEPQMKCSICGREFFRRDSCTDHLRTIHKKTTEEYSNFIILYNKNRLSHLYLEQTAELKK